MIAYITVGADDIPLAKRFYAAVLPALGYGLASMYYLEHRDKLTPALKRQFISVMGAVVLFLIVFSDWSDKTI